MEVGGNLPMFITDSGRVIKEKFKQTGMNGVLSYLEECREKWKSCPLNIAVVGESGAGKSTFINTIRGLRVGDEGSAEIGVKQCTLEATSYKHPENDNLLLWDLPGYGSIDFQREIYFEKIKVEKFDFFLILSHTRFTQDDSWLASSLKEKGKLFYFVRTKVDNDIYNTNKGHRKKKSKDEILSTIRDDCQENLASLGMSDTPLLLINGQEANEYDFNELNTTLIHSVPGHKRETIVLSLSGTTKGIIDEKKKVLQKRIWYSAVFSGIAGAVPVPGIGIAVDIPLLLREAIMYRKQFGLHEEGLSHLASLLKIPVQDLSKSLQLKSTGISLTTKGIVVLIREGFAGIILHDAAKYAIPIVGSFISAGASYWSTKRFLESLLELMYSDAMKIHAHMVKIIESSTLV